MAEEKKKRGCFRGFLFLVILTGVAIYAYVEFGGISFGDPDIRSVQTSSPPGETVRFEKAFRRFFSSPEWSSGIANDGNTYVNFSGKAFYGDNIELYEIQFLVGVDNGVGFWKLHAVEIADEPQSLLFINTLIDKVYEEYQ